MAYSENAPELESKLHNHFSEKRLNLVNLRKEFFEVTIDEIEKWAEANKTPITFTKVAEAREYRETHQIRKQGKKAISKATTKEIPASIESLFDE